MTKTRSRFSNARVAAFLLLGSLNLHPTMLLSAEPGLAALEGAAFRAATDAAAPCVVQLVVIGGSAEVEGISLADGPATGVILSPDGYVVTSLYRFTPAPATVIARLSDGRQFAARQVATDFNRKLVLLKLQEADELPIAEVAPYDAVRVGEWAIAIGRAFRPDRPHVGIGIISAKNRLYGRAVQTDAAVSAANYGGALVNLQGRVIGIFSPMSPSSESAIAGTEWYDSGIGFAVPLETWLPIAERLKAGKDLHRGILGIGFEPGQEHSTAAKVKTLAPTGPGEKAGLAAGDVLESVDGKQVGTLSDVKFAIMPRYAGDEVKLAYRRGDDVREVSVTLVDPSTLAPAAEDDEQDEPGEQS
jgi:serine protease Do